jgi:diguanylate cyclase (GGDEF)-like protein
MKTILKNVTLKYEIILLLIINTIFYFIFSELDLLEILYVYSLEHESLELDEFIPLFITISISLLIFSIRRLQESKNLSSKLFYMANYDAMTKIHNRRYMNDILEIECERANRSGSVFSLLLLDIDDFKHINDNFGHQTGDKVLVRFSEMLELSTRKLDVLCRWGGEEFLILCRDTDQVGAEVVAQKILELMRTFKCDLVDSVTASIGVVSTGKEVSLDSLFHRADTAMYEAKTKGKNQYIVG